MVKCAKENKIVLLALTICLFFTLTISSGCKKKEQTEEARQDVPAEEIKDISTSERVVKTVASGKIDLRILYAGLLDTERAKDFVDFLSKHFEQVETTDYITFTGNEAVDFDVAIIDHDGKDFRAPRPRISRKYTRATVTMGVPGAFICRTLSLKTGYL
ncbi:MAG: hypothetical protein ACYS6K_18495 [Planctomycetota bacterium]|jgi:hypothetical protein